MSRPTKRVALQGVQETLLWTLYFRAAEARRPDAVLRDPKAIELVDSIDYPFARFGEPRQIAQVQALRVLAFDREIRAFLARRPDATVIALGEGLETQFWRVDNGSVRWLSVELPETADVRRRLLPDEDRRRTIACSALDERWMAEVGADGTDVLLTAQGLLMYLRPPQVRALFAACAERFPAGTMIFDAVPRRMSERTRARPSSGSGYRPPPMPWGMDATEIPRIRTAYPGITDVRRVRAPRGRGFWYGYAWPLLDRVPMSVRRLVQLSPGRLAPLFRYARPLLSRPMAGRLLRPRPMTIVRVRFGGSD